MAGFSSLNVISVRALNELVDLSGESEKLDVMIFKMRKVRIVAGNDSLDCLKKSHKIERPEIVQETTEMISQIKDTLKAARGHQKSYVDKRRKPLEFSVGDHVLLTVSR
nr:putative reverse transcriptase domain-containing protein [Tanacetum cinerariifolium]